jgi:Ca-activated chloride channel family protein
VVSVPWHRIETFEDVDKLALEVAGIKRQWRNFSTAIGEALQVSLNAFEDVPECTRRIIDVSGDGVSNEGFAPSELWPAFEAAGVTVNGLAIESDLDILAQYYRTEMIFGPGSFVVRAESYLDYPRAIRQKLLREITKQTASLSRN